MERMTIQEMKAFANDAVEFVKGQTSALLTPWPLNLNSAGSEEIDLQGNFIYVFEATDGDATINVQFNRKASEAPSLTLVKSTGYVHPYNKVNLSWSAQTGKTMTVILGSFAKELMDIIDNRSQAEITTSLAQIEVNTLATKTSVDSLKTSNESDLRSLNGSKGTQISAYGIANNGATATIRTVTALKNFFLTSICGSYSHTATGFGGIGIYDGTGTLVLYIFYANSYPTTGEQSFNRHFGYPLIIPAEYSVKAYAGTNCSISAHIHGWEETA